MKLLMSRISQNLKVVLDILEENRFSKVLDLGCGTGDFTVEICKKVGTNDVYGVKLYEKDIRSVRTKEIKANQADLNKDFPFQWQFFDVVHSNQVIEHLYNVDGFIRKIYRVLKPRGVTILSTGNLATLHNKVEKYFGVSFYPFRREV